MDAAGVREKSGWFAAGAVALDGPIAAAFWSFSVCHSVEVPLVWNGVCRGYGYVSERSRNESAYLLAG